MAYDNLFTPATTCGCGASASIPFWQVQQSKLIIQLEWAKLELLAADQMIATLKKELENTKS